METSAQNAKKKGKCNNAIARCHTLTLFIERANNVLFSGFQLQKHLLSGQSVEIIHPFDHSLDSVVDVFLFFKPMKYINILLTSSVIEVMLQI